MTDKSTKRSTVRALLDDVESYLDNWYDSSVPFTFHGRVRWTPPTDVYETETDYRITLAAPGVRTADLEVRYENGLLVIHGVRCAICDDGRRYHKMEIPVGPFERAVRLPRSIDVEAISVRYEDGLVRVRVPKSSPTRRDVPID